MHHSVDVILSSQIQNYIHIYKRRSSKFAPLCLTKNVSNFGKTTGMKPVAFYADKNITFLQLVSISFLHESRDRNTYIQTPQRILKRVFSAGDGNFSGPAFLHQRSNNFK